MSRPFDELKVIGNAWGALTGTASTSHNDLAISIYHAMVDASAARGVWESQDPEVRKFIIWLLDQRNMLALADDLPATLARPADEIAALLERTRQVGIVDVDEALVRGSRVVSSGDNLYAWGARNQTEAVRKRVVSISAEAGKVLREIIEESKRPTPFEEPFTTLLQGLDQEQVQRIALQWKLPEAARYFKSELIGVMTEFLATEQGRDMLISALPAASQKAFAYLESEGGRLRASQVRTHFGWDEHDFRAAILPLVQRALLWDVLEGEARHLFIPADLMPGRRTETAKISPASLPKLETTAPYSVEGKLAYELPWDILTLLAMAAEGDLPLTLQDTRITKRVAKRINDALLQPDDIKNGTDYIDMLVHFASTLALLSEKRGDQPSLAITRKADDWTKLSFAAQRRRLFGLWQEDRKWSEPATYGTMYYWNSDMTGGRKRLITHLLELPAGQWISLDAFLRKIHLTEPFLIWSQDEVMRRFGLRALQGFRSQWFNIEGRIIADMLKTVLLWLGALEIGRDKQKRFISFRVTEEGRALFDPEHAADVAPPAKMLMVQPNYEVLVLHPESRVLWDLMRSAELVRHDRVSVYQITKESIINAVEEGLSPEQIKEFLDANTGKGLPQNVTHSIDDWARLVKRATITRATLIEVENSEILDEMMASRKTRRYVRKRLSPTVAIANLPEAGGSAREDAWQKLMKELRTAGYLTTFIGETEVADAATAESDPAQAAANGDGKSGTARKAPVRSVTRTRKGDTFPTSKTGTE